MAKFEMESILLVEDLYCGDRDEAFEIAADSPHRAARDALVEVRDALGFKRRPPRVVVESCAFIEFDSGNLSHAGAHYIVTVGGLTADEVATLERVINGGA